MSPISSNLKLLTNAYVSYCTLIGMDVFLNPNPVEVIHGWYMAILVIYVQIL